MKERFLTGTMIFLVLIFAFLARELSQFVFDVLVIGVCVFAANESSNLFAKMGFYNSKTVVMLYPLAMYSFLILSIYLNIALLISITLQLVLILIFMAITFFTFLLSKKYTDNEIKTRKYKGKTTRFVFNKSIQTIISMIYPTFFFMSFVLINHLDKLGLTTLDVDLRLLSFVVLLFAFLIGVFTDIFSMLTGKLIGGKKLAPKISPSKTISGFIGGVVFTLLFVLGIYVVFDSFELFNSLFYSIGIELWHVVLLSVLGSLICNLGDLFESFLKRKAKVKDSGNILPGHGGVLDRIDSHTFNAAFVLIFFVILL